MTGPRKRKAPEEMPDDNQEVFAPGSDEREFEPPDREPFADALDGSEGPEEELAPLEDETPNGEADVDFEAELDFEEGEPGEDDLEEIEDETLDIELGTGLVEQADSKTTGIIVMII